MTRWMGGKGEWSVCQVRVNILMILLLLLLQQFLAHVTAPGVGTIQYSASSVRRVLGRHGRSLIPSTFPSTAAAAPPRRRGCWRWRRRRGGRVSESFPVPSGSLFSLPFLSPSLNMVILYMSSDSPARHSLSSFSLPSRPAFLELLPTCVIT